jgi:hypothetical protein
LLVSFFNHLFSKASLALLVLFAVFFTSCEKDEPLYPQPKVAAGLQTQTFEMGETYSNQLYFDFETQTKTTNLFGQWDLGFACNGTPHVIVCAGKSTSYALAKVTDTHFDDLHSLQMSKLNWGFDNPNGHIDSLVTSNCFQPNANGYEGNPNETYVLDLGSDSIVANRFIKIKFLSVRGGMYEFQWTYVFNPSKINITKIYTNPEYNYTYFNFGTLKTVENELIKNNKWDIVFTTYKESIHDVNGQPYPYIIRGALINQHKISVCEINSNTSGISFDKMTKELAQSFSMGKTLNEIGYDWKVYDQNSSKYTIVQNKYFLLKTESGNWFKMRFIDFYDDQGRKGYPKMAWEVLK